jgi:hypothetical protein
VRARQVPLEHTSDLRQGRTRLLPYFVEAGFTGEGARRENSRWRFSPVSAILRGWFFDNALSDNVMSNNTGKQGGTAEQSLRP